MVRIKSISEKIYDISEILWKVVLLVIALGYVYYIASYHPVETVEEEKPDYIPADIEKKYPEDFKSYGEFIEKVKKNAVKSDKKIEEDKYHAKYYDSKGREIYIIDELWGRQKNSWHGGRGGAILERAFPNEKGILYDEKGNIAEKLEIQTTGSQTYHSKGTDDEPRRNLYVTGFNPSSNNKYTRYYYDEKNKLIKEVEMTPSNWFIKNEIEYKNGKKKSEKKIIDYEVTYKENNRIYVEITKEYDKNEKLIKKFVLRKNRLNAIRSETNFDFIKGKIVTKYYDGDKAFATVTETLIGKDRAIVKREREEVKIFDNYNKITEKSYNYIRNIIKNNSIYKVLKVNKNYNTFIFEYNDVKNGIDKNSFFYETFNLVAKEENGVTGQFGGEELEIYFYKKNSVIKKIFKDFYKKSYSNEENPIKDWESIIFYSNEKDPNIIQHPFYFVVLLHYS